LPAFTGENQEDVDRALAATAQRGQTRELR
jgi:hypothetical protein